MIKKCFTADFLLSFWFCPVEMIQKDIHVYNWGDYIDEALLTKFEEETGIRVIYDTFSSNENMYIKVKQGIDHFDVIVPSDYD